ncbi:MAG: DNA-binding response regulator [Desulfobacteraceae bacterium]|jgi:DNA-binding response OmpR family regulator|nr:MAG: DNA-binding response regulator [Desulfobacteraceae bacterium]
MAFVLVVDDDKDIVTMVADTLEEEGYQVIRAYDGLQALQYARTRKVDLYILDIMMPGLDGLALCHQIREISSSPIIFLSAKSRNSDVVRGLKTGADDYLRKPFSLEELIARVDAHLRRESRRIPSTQLQVGSWLLDKEKLEVTVAGDLIELSTKEFKILWYLAENRGRVLSREQIYSAVWGELSFGDLNTVTVHIRNLRAKLDPAGEIIKTVWGAGYKLAGEGR